MRRALRKPRSVSEGPNLLPLLIQVLASFTKADGVIMEEEIDSSLGFLRYDYPEAVYSELRQLFRQALYEQQDLAAMAQKLGAQLSTERKIMLGVQLYDLISQAGLKQEEVVAFYSFMSQMGMAAQAIDIVYQLNASEDSDPSIYQHGASPLESLSFGRDGKADIILKSLSEADHLMAFRYHDLILLKNYSGQNVSVRGRPLARGGFCRIYPGQRILVGDQVLSTVGGLLRSGVAGVSRAAFAARLGGEEFLVVLPGTAPDEAERHLDALRLLVRSHPWAPVTGGQPVTVSIGAVIAAAPGIPTQAALLADADRCLYAAKRAGRDRVVVDRDPCRGGQRLD